MDRCREIIAEGAYCQFAVGSFLFVIVGGCDLDKTYSGPKLSVTDEGTYQITPEFIDKMIEWFKSGKTLPKRYVWEIVLGAYSYFIQEESLVTVDVGEDATCDVIGDVHGVC